MNNLAFNLRQLLEKNKISPSELARNTNVGQSVIHRIIAGETNNPKIETLKPIAKYFSISVDQLTGNAILFNDGKLLDMSQSNAIRVRVLPLLTIEQVESWLNRDNIDNLSFITIADCDVNDMCYSIQIKDSTMHPRFSEGTYFVVDPNLQAENGDFIVFCRSDSKKGSVRQLLLDSDEKYLKALNPDFRTILVNNEYKFLGTVVQARTNYKYLTKNSV